MLRGHRSGSGPPALLLHGGPGFSDYTEGCADELSGLFATIRYTQRGTAPSTGGPPFSIESHMADALAVLDHFGIDRAWAIGHSWGGHLALHLLVAHPDRLLGVIAIDALGAQPPFDEMAAHLRRELSEEELARVDEIEERRRRGEATEAELLERWTIMWPQYLAQPGEAPPTPVVRIGAQCSADTNESIEGHLERGTLVERLPRAQLPVLFVHGELDLLPVRFARATAALIPNAKVEVIERCGHFPWLERPGELRRAAERYLRDGQR